MLFRLSYNTLEWFDWNMLCGCRSVYVFLCVCVCVPVCSCYVFFRWNIFLRIPPANVPIDSVWRGSLKAATAWARRCSLYGWVHKLYVLHSIEYVCNTCVPSMKAENQSIVSPTSEISLTMNDILEISVLTKHNVISTLNRRVKPSPQIRHLSYRLSTISQNTDNLSLHRLNLWVRHECSFFEWTKGCGRRINGVREINELALAPLGSWLLGNTQAGFTLLEWRITGPVLGMCRKEESSLLDVLC